MRCTRGLASFRSTTNARSGSRDEVMRPRFHIPVLLSPSHVGSTIVLPAEVGHHVVRVLRLARGDPITLFDGSGGEYAAVLEKIGRSGATARIERFDAIARDSPL